MLGHIRCRYRYHFKRYPGITLLFPLLHAACALGMTAGRVKDQVGNGSGSALVDLYATIDNHARHLGVPTYT